jgi:acyl-coenzyme A synthetase/AMP-(fatty) acid ligase/acyl carrier protein
VFGALASGGALHLPSAECSADPEALAEYFDSHAVDGLKVVPSHLQALLASPAAARLLPRRYLVLGGEALRAPLLDAIAALAPDCAVFNHYGPTETTVGCLCGRVDGSVVYGASAALGTPLANVTLAIVDANGATVPVGVAGELLIGGAGVARGYLNRAALDAERFIGTSTRHYRSGDLVRLRDDGQLEFVSRADDQLKVRGFRVEPGEIAAALARHAEVRDCVVLAERFGDDEMRLLAYLVPATLNSTDLRSWLAAQLPDYMVPSQFVALDALPLTANGKVDRQALAALGRRSHGEAGSPVSLVGTQATIAAIWCEQLHIEGVRAEDKFFDLGGNSLGALQVVGRLKKATGVRVTPRDLLLQTLAQLASLIDDRNAGKRGDRAAG